MEYGSHVYGCSTHTALLNWVESKAFRLINSPPLTDCLDSFSHRRNVASLSIFYFYFHANCSSEHANCMPPPSHDLAAHDFLLLLITILSISLMQELTSIFTLSSLTLVNSGSLFFCLFFSICISAYDLNSFKKRSVNTSLMLNETPSIAFISPTIFFAGSGWRQVGFFLRVFALLWSMSF